MVPLTDAERRDFWEICDERDQMRSTILTPQLLAARWHEQIGDATIADGIRAQCTSLELRGESMREAKAKKPEAKSES